MSSRLRTCRTSWRCSLRTGTPSMQASATETLTRSHTGAGSVAVTAFVHPLFCSRCFALSTVFCSCASGLIGLSPGCCVPRLYFSTLCLAVCSLCTCVCFKGLPRLLCCVYDPAQLRAAVPAAPVLVTSVHALFCNISLRCCKRQDC
jgi:hypothetical protein